MLKTKMFTVLAALALTMLALPAAASAEGVDTDTGATVASVEYNGSMTSLAALEAEVGEVHCHDAKGMGELTCFATEREADLDLLSLGGLPPEVAKATATKWGVGVPRKTRTVTPTASSTCHPWVTTRLYDGDKGTGSSVNLYCDYPKLSQVGWNDRANSMICMVCKNVSGANPHGVDNLTLFFNEQMKLQLVVTKLNMIVEMDKAKRNAASSNRIAFN